MPAKNFSDTSIRYNQQNRTIEKFLADLRVTKQATFSLESCNVCSAACAVESVGGIWKYDIPFYMSQADGIFNYIYSFPSGLPIKDNSNGICENECIENLAFAINNLTDCKASYFYNNDNKQIISELKNLLKNNVAIVTSYQDNTTTGHYICIVNYDKGNFIYYDSWNNNSRNRNGGRLESFNEKDLEKCIKHRYMVVTK